MIAIEELRALKSDAKKWKWLQKHQGEGLLVLLDNDDTFVVDINNDNADSVHFDDYIGNSPGVTVLLGLLGIKNEGV